VYLNISTPLALPLSHRNQVHGSQCAADNKSKPEYAPGLPSPRNRDRVSPCANRGQLACSNLHRVSREGGELRRRGRVRSPVNIPRSRGCGRARRSGASLPRPRSRRALLALKAALLVLLMQLALSTLLSRGARWCSDRSSAYILAFLLAPSSGPTQFRQPARLPRSRALCRAQLSALAALRWPAHFLWSSRHWCGGPW